MPAQLKSLFIDSRATALSLIASCQLSALGAKIHKFQVFIICAVVGIKRHKNSMALRTFMTSFTVSLTSGLGPQDGGRGGGGKWVAF